MSSILLSNPYVTPAPPAHPPGADQPSAAMAVAPVQTAATTSGADNSTGFSGQGSGYGGGSGHQAYLAQARSGGPTGRPADATPGSVVNAQAQAGEKPEYVPFGANLPKVEMPNVLPTAPWFKKDD